MLHRVPVKVSAAVLASAACMLVATAPAYAAANPRNHGHHYGQLKHPKHHPVPSPNPQPNPQPTPKPVPGPASKPVTVNLSRTVSKGVTDALPVVALSPAATTQPDQTITLLPTSVPTDPLWWLILTLLPALAVLLFIALRGIALRLMRRLASGKQLAAAPAAL